MAVTAIVATLLAGSTAVTGAMGGLQSRSIEPRAQAKNWERQGVVGVRGIDISLWDHVGAPNLDFQALHDQGVRFVFVKTSDSNNKADQQAAGWWAVDRPAARAAKILVGSYQYAYPTKKKSRIDANARKMATRISNRLGKIPPGQLPAVLDLESAPSNLGPKLLTRWAVTWLNTVESLTGRTPILYTYTSFANTRLRAVPELTRFPFWQAEYRQGASRPGALRGWPDGPHIWQFSSNGKLRGLPPQCDLDIWLGSIPELLKLAGLPASAQTEWDLPGSAITPIPTPTPTPTPIVTPTPTPTPTPTSTPTPTPTPTPTEGITLPPDPAPGP